MSEEEKILIERIAFLRYEHAKTADAGQKFSIKKEIEQDEKRLREIRNSSFTNNHKKPVSNQNKMKQDPPKPTPEKKIPEWIFLALGVFFTLLPFITVFIVSCLEDAQYKAIRILFALGGGFLGGFMLGFISIKTAWLRAGGGLALAVLFYIWNPAEGVTNDCAKIIKGTVYIENKTKEGVTVKLQQAQRDDKTNSYGIFEMKINQNDLKSSLDFTFQYSELNIDTLITIEKDSFDLQNLKFELMKGNKPIIPIPTNPTKVETNKKETTVSKPKIIYHSVTLKGNSDSVDYVLFDNNETNKIQPENGIVKLPNLGEEMKNVKVYFKDTSKENYDLNINNQTTEIAIQ